MLKRNEELLILKKELARKEEEDNANLSILVMSICYANIFQGCRPTIPPILKQLNHILLNLVWNSFLAVYYYISNISFKLILIVLLFLFYLSSIMG